MTRLPAPEQWVITKMTEEEVAEMIERHIDFVDEDGRSVRLQKEYVRHFMKRDDGRLPTLVAITTLPIVLADAGILGRVEGFDRLRGIEFHIQPEVSACVPLPDSVSDADIERAMRFLVDDWLVDVATDFAGKCVIVAAALTIIERSLLDQRPAFFVTSGRRGGGKTTTLKMLLQAVTGIAAAAAAWSTNEEERKKALLSYFMYGVPYILWDNIARGTQIACPHIERSCTAAYYMDRKLGVSQMVGTAASSIHLFTGNNIGPKGDLASRSLLVRLSVDRLDPENRKFKHPDPIGWTDDHRAELLQAFYTILVGNPTLKLARAAPMQTRFAMWWRVVGSAIEHAAKLMVARAEQSEPGSYDDEARPAAIAFKNLFEARDEEDEDANDLGDVLDALYGAMPRQFEAKDVALFINTQKVPVVDDNTGKERQDAVGNAIMEDNVAGATVRDFLYADDPKQMPTPRSVGKRLREHVDNPARHGAAVLTLKKVPSSYKASGLRYFISRKEIEPELGV